MRILSLSAIVCSLVLAGCTKMPEYVEQDEYRRLTSEEIEANVINVFGTTFDPNQDWSTTVNNSVTITANANLDNIVKVQILTESPFFNEDAKVLNEIAAKNGETVELYYDAPADYEQLIAACVNDKNVYYIQVFNVGQKAVSFSTYYTNLFVLIFNSVSSLFVNTLAAQGDTANVTLAGGVSVAANSGAAVVTNTISIPRIFSTLSYSISGNSSCSRMPRL